MYRCARDVEHDLKGITICTFKTCLEKEWKVESKEKKEITEYLLKYSKPTHRSLMIGDIDKTFQAYSKVMSSWKAFINLSTVQATVQAFI